MSVKPLQRAEIQGFSKGLVTDLNPLNSQIDTTVDERNFELNKNGTRSRRLGLNRELNGGSFRTGLDFSRLRLASISSFLWKGVGGDPALQFYVLQVGSTLYFFEINSGSNGETVIKGTVELPTSEASKISYGAVQGSLAITTGSANMLLVQYDPLTQLFSSTVFRIQIRDFFGIEETINPAYETDNDYRGPLNWQHYYNLYNQGWAIPRKPWSYGDPAPVDAVYLGAGDAPEVRSPSNGDRVWSGLANKPISETSQESFEGFHYRQFQGVLGANNLPSKGFFIIDAFNRGSSRVTEWIQHKNKYPQTGNLLSGLNPPADSTSGGPTSLASHAGRLFYSGIKGSVTEGDKRSPNYNNYVFFTQLVKNRQDFGKCYQEGDPTSRDSNDVVDTDGGYIVVSDAINIHTMYSMGDKLFLIAENGVWSVAGGSGYGFAATNYLVERISTFGGMPGQSFVEMGGTGFYWGFDGVYTISKNQYGDYTVENQSKKVIDNFFSSIPNEAAQTVQGFADKQRNQIRWLYTEGSVFQDGVTKELILDLNFNAFYPFEIAKHPNNTAYVLSGVQVGDFSISYTLNNVVVGSDTVVVGSSIVEANEISKRAVDSNVKYVSVYLEGGSLWLSFCGYNNPNYQDWEFVGTPVDAPAYMESNYFTAGDFSTKKQIPYVIMAFAETERTTDELGNIDQESSCLGQFMWDFTHLARSNKWSREVQLYRKSRWFFGETDIDNGYSLNLVKTKVRGIGQAFSLKVRTEPLKNCHIYGWSLTLTKNEVP